MKDDTDSDGRTDLQELNDGTVPFIYVDNNLDTDGDGLMDGDEWIGDKEPFNDTTNRNLDGFDQSGIKTDPLNEDTDRGGYNDGFEIDCNWNPLYKRDDDLDRFGIIDPDNKPQGNIGSQGKYPVTSGGIKKAWYWLKDDLTPK